MSKDAHNNVEKFAKTVSNKQKVKPNKQKITHISFPVTEESTLSAETPKGGTKRILTPSPVLKQQFSKKSRQKSGGMATAAIPGDSETAVDSVGEDEMEQEGETSYVTLPLVDVASELKEAMMPEIENLIQHQIPDIKSIIDSAIDSAVDRLNETLMKEINYLKGENSKLKKENVELTQSVAGLTEKVEMLEIKTDANEQYSRRNSFRISGVPEEQTENTDTVVFKLASDLGVNLDPRDIDRSHRVGMPRAGRNRAIIVKFATYAARRSLYSKRMDLRNKEHWQHTYINEDLTTRRSKLLYTARQYVRAKMLKSAYSADGRIYVKDMTDKTHQLVKDDDLRAFGSLPPTA